MSNRIKIVTIGGGSSFTPDLVQCFITRYDELPISELWLVDIETGKEKLAVIGALVKKMVEEANIPMKIHLTLDRREALPNADYVITQFSVGQHDANILDERISAKHNMLGEETNGAGGVFKALRVIPVMYEIIEDIKELCEKTWIINFTNPGGIISEAVFRYADFDRFIGVCNEPIKITNHLATVLNIKVKKLVPYFAGLNHMSYVLNLFHQNKDRLSEALLTIKTKQIPMNNIDPIGLDYEFIQNLGVYPSPYYKYFYCHDKMLTRFIEQYKIGSTPAEQLKQIDITLIKKYKDIKFKRNPQEIEKLGGAYYSDAACNIISSIHNDKREYHVVNTVNDGYITDLADGCAIEITSRITKDGPVPVYIGKLPAEIKGLIQNMKTFEEVLVDAIYDKDLSRALFALQINPLTKSITNAKKAFEELVIAHRKHLDYYFEEKK